MEFSEYSFRHGKEILQITHSEILNEISDVLDSLEPFAYGAKKNITPKTLIANVFESRGWETEIEIPLGTGKSDYCDIGKGRVFIEQEYSRFEMFFRDFFRFLLLYDERRLDVGVIITHDESVFDSWGTGVKSYSSARASLGKLVDFLEGKYAGVVRVPIWCICIK
ncbi:MAG: BglII/BstYI family type II restriction endonuclease [Candidatus Hodarchaeales archaeon]